MKYRRGDFVVLNDTWGSRTDPHAALVLELIKDALGWVDVLVLFDGRVRWVGEADLFTVEEWSKRNED